MDSISNNFLSVVRSNDLNKIQSYLRKNIPNQDELVSRVNSPQTPDDIRNFLAEYYYLLTYDLHYYLSYYYNKNINNFLVISFRGYLPLLQLKQSELPSVINTVSNDGANALNYVLSDPNNIDVVIFLINNQITIDDTSLNKIKEYSENIKNINLSDGVTSTFEQSSKSDRNRYQQLYDQLVPEEESLFTKLPNDIFLMITNGDPKEIEKLCQSNRYIHRRYCMNPNSNFWKDLYNQKFGSYPETSNVRTYKYRYIKSYYFGIDKKHIHDEIKLAIDLNNEEILTDVLSELSDKLLDQFGDKAVNSIRVYANKSRFKNFALEYALETGNIYMIKKIIGFSNNNLDVIKSLDYILKIAPIETNFDFIKDILNLYPSEDSLKSALRYLMEKHAYNQYIDFIKYLIELGANNFNSTMTTAASRGQNNIVQLMLDLGADDLHNTLINAAINKHYNVYPILRDKVVTNCQINSTIPCIPLFELEAKWAALIGDVKTINKIINNSNNPIDYHDLINMIMKFSVAGGHVHITIKMIKLGANDFSGAWESRTSMKRIHLTNILKRYIDNQNKAT